MSYNNNVVEKTNHNSSIKEKEKMAFKKNTENRTVYTALVTRAKKITETSKGGDVIGLDVTFNGVSVSGCTLIEYKNKTGNVDYIFKFPQRKGNNDEYFNIVWLPVSAELRADIIAQATKIVCEA